MNEFCLRIVVRLIRGWTRLYTTGTMPALRDRRRAEIESDMWESLREPRPARVAVQMLSRFVFGVRDDLAWRISCREPSRFARIAAVAAITAGVLGSWLLLAVGRAAVLPSPAPLVRHARVLPPPPPPPPPPCRPSGTGRESPTPCTR